MSSFRPAQLVALHFAVLFLLSFSGNAFAANEADDEAAANQASVETAGEDRPRRHGRTSRDGFELRGDPWRRFSRDNDRPHDGNSRWDRHPWGAGPQTYMRESGPIQSGYLFINGQYAPPPTLLRLDDEQLFVNGEKVHGLPNEASEQRRGSPATRSFFRMRDALQNGAIVFIELGDDGLSGIVNILPRHESGLTLLQRLAGVPVEEHSVALPPETESWLRGFQPSAELAARAKQDIEVVQLPSTNESFEPASLGAWSYVLTVLGMLLAAVAVGQLFVSRSLLTWQAGDDEAEIARAAVRCILVVAGLSLLDLVWTLVSLQAGVMHELNPLAANFVHSTFALTTFKIGITFAGAAVLYMLRTHRPAQLAAWWLCMVCTLVTVRWVAFTSLFVT